MNTDLDLFRNIKQGNKQSFELLFRKYYAPMCIFARQYIYDKDECEEIVQTVFTQLWEKKLKIIIESSIKHYLFKSVRNRCLNYLKHHKIRDNHRKHVLESPHKHYTDSFFEPDLIEKIYRCIEELPERRREMFILSREHGLKYREIAEKLNISIKTVETQMGNALRELREKLKDYKPILFSIFILKKFQ